MADPQPGRSEDKHPGMMGDGTEEQNLNQKGDPSARIKKDEVEEAFGKKDGQGDQAKH
ncbi:MAG TPA: hypothetical protein VIE16_10080 [Phenylobacterium sp.]|jgi:hypothetical protein